ncbi:hypothetical protein BR93DRAFT_547663 [Coniochaeta sp. PMI_546]|nr:hypothetical protein BR93DRAFT_547663 [Coniochaeta sp. PMI_546]
MSATTGHLRKKNKTFRSNMKYRGKGISEGVSQQEQVGVTVSLLVLFFLLLPLISLLLLHALRVGWVFPLHGSFEGLMGWTGVSVSFGGFFFCHGLRTSDGTQLTHPFDSVWSSTGCLSAFSSDEMRF